MTNEQLRIVLSSIHGDLFRACAESYKDVYQALGSPTVQERRHVETGCLGLFCNNERHYDMVEVAQDIDHLLPIQDAIARLQHYIDVLTPPPADS
jgi:hypothetical protein